LFQPSAVIKKTILQTPHLSYNI